MDAQQKSDFLSSIHDDGKGFIGTHSAAMTVRRVAGVRRDDRRLLRRSSGGHVRCAHGGGSPGVPRNEARPASFVLRDEIYELRNYSRDKVRVLRRLDASKIDLGNKNVHRSDRDFAVTWAKMYGKGHVYYTTLGHVRETWDKPEFQEMIVEAIKWATGMTNADITPRTLNLTK